MAGNRNSLGSGVNSESVAVPGSCPSSSSKRALTTCLVRGRPDVAVTRRPLWPQRPDHAVPASTRRCGGPGGPREPLLASIAPRTIDSSARHASGEFREPPTPVVSPANLAEDYVQGKNSLTSSQPATTDSLQEGERRVARSTATSEGGRYRNATTDCVRTSRSGKRKEAPGGQSANQACGKLPKSRGRRRSAP